jgi:hypothetical protein
VEGSKGSLEKRGAAGHRDVECEGYGTG